MITKSNIYVCRDTALQFMVEEGTGMGVDDILSHIVNFKEMAVGWIQVIVDGADDDDYTFQLFASAIKDPNSFVPYGDARFIEPGCNGIAWNLRDFGFLYARVLYKKGGVTAGTMKILARAKKG